MKENLLWRLIARKLSGEASAEEIEQLGEVLGNNPHAQVTYEALSSFWEHPVKESTPDNIDEIFNTHLLSAIKEEANSEDPQIIPVYKRLLLNKAFRVAASVTVIATMIAVGFLIWKPGNKVLAAEPPPLQKIETTNGTKTNTILPDGSKVWLNSGSRLTYKTFNNSLREVVLEGEAYFDVIKDPKRPFIVHTNVIDIKVLGTAFNVKSYPDEKTVEASLVRGLIEVTRLDKPDQKVLLHPNEKITVLKKATQDISAKSPVNNALKVNPVENYKISGFTYAKLDKSVIETSWTQNKLAFEDMPFDDLAVQLERWYDVKINFRDDKSKKLVFRGSFVNETITEAMEALKLNGDFNYKINNNEVEIFTNK
ncbi:MAG: FecR family protein [Sphingobacteriales bacterium]|nr:FecR family protein [Sphingobacteriales bacterium]MBI3720892.1 FecR family protein [Sphingobacteriales bacterium]